VCPPGSERGEGGGFSEEVIGSPWVQGPIVHARRRCIGSDLCSRHNERKLRKTRTGRNKGSARGKLWCETKTPRKPYSREKPRKQGKEEDAQENSKRGNINRPRQESL